MAEVELGVVMVTPFGEYNPATTYPFLALVDAPTASYVSRINENNQPLENAVAWQIIARKGRVGNPFTYADFTPEQLANLQAVSYKLQSLAVATYANLPAGLTLGDANKGYTVQSDLNSKQAIYVWDGAAFPANGNGLVVKGENGGADENYQEKEPGKNKFDKSVTQVTGFYIGTSDGLLSASATSTVSYPVPIKPLTAYYLSGRNVATVFNIRFLDSSKALLPPIGASYAYNGGVPFTQNCGFTSPTSAAFIQFEIRYGGVGIADNIQLEEGVFASAYEAYELRLADYYNKTETGSLIDTKIAAAEVIPLSSAIVLTSPNLFDKNTMVVEDFTMNGGDGTPVAQAGSSITTFIKVNPSTAYSFRNITNGGTLAVMFFNASKVYISRYLSYEAGFYNHTTPVGCEYVRYYLKVSPSTNDYLLTQYEQSAVQTPYQPFGVKKVVKKQFLEENKFAYSDIFMIPSYGQSLSINTGAGSSTFSAAVPIIIDKTGANVNIQDMNGGYAESFLELSNEFKTLPSGFRIMTSANGVGGAEIRVLSIGSTAYNNLLEDIKTGKAYAVANSKTFNVPAICWTQGEAEMLASGGTYGTGTFDPALYAAKLKQLQLDLSGDIKGITGQDNDVKFIMYQVGSQNHYKRYPRIAMEQLRLCVTDESFTMAKIMYDLEYAGDNVHQPAKSYRQMGNNYGMALYNTIVLGKRIKPIFPVRSWVTGTDLYIKFYVPVKPLVLDTTLVSPLADGKYGFSLVVVSNDINGTIALSPTTITAVALYSADVVKISMSAVPAAGTRLTYAVNGTGWDNLTGTGGVTGTSGRSTGARGNLRDSQTNINVISDYFNLYNWCPIFEIVL